MLRSSFRTSNVSHNTFPTQHNQISFSAKTSLLHKNNTKFSNILKPVGLSRKYASNSQQMDATTILCVRKGKDVAIVGDGQITQGQSIVLKGNARKVRRVGKESEVIAGFAGSTADCLTLFEKLEAKLEEYPRQLTRASVELAKMWRTDKFLRRLEAMMIVADEETSLMLSGNGDVIEPERGVVAIGSGGAYAEAAARALVDVPNLSPKEVALKSMNIASEMCVFTNNNFIALELPHKEKTEDEKLEEKKEI